MHDQRAVLNKQLLVVLYMYLAYAGFMILKTSMLVASPDLVAENLITKTQWSAILGWGAFGAIVGKFVSIVILNIQRAMSRKHATVLNSAYPNTMRRHCMYHRWITLVSASMLAIAMTLNIPSYAEAVEKNVFKAHLIPVLGNDELQPMITFGEGTIRIKNHGVRVTLDMDKISVPQGTSGELQLTLKINGNRELVILPFDVTTSRGEMETVTLDASLLEIADVVKPGDAVKIRRARITIAGEVVGTIGFLEKKEAAFEGLPSVIDSLRAQGESVALGEEIIQPFFSVPGQIIILNGESV